MKIKNQEGFTLVELMVVVAIIGILSAVAIPNFQKYQAKSKTSEAKLALAAIYSAETAFFSDADTYATCLSDMGYEPSGTAAERYYSVGFDSGQAFNNGGSTNGVTCAGAAAVNQSFFLGTKGRGGDATGRGAGDINSTTPTVNSFSAGAVGAVTNTAADGINSWRIDQDKAVVQDSVGY